MTDVLFLHIPKTGGTYVAKNDNVISPIHDLNHSVFVKMPFYDNDYPPSPGYREKMRQDISMLSKPNRIVFATVRNPYSWLVSYWHHSGAKIDESKNPTHYDYKLARKGFKEFVKTIAARDDGWPCKKFIHFALFTYYGNFIPDRLVHQEHLDHELLQLALDYKLRYVKRDRVRVSEGSKFYQEYYDDELIDIVVNTWERELYLFGYDFYGHLEGAGILDSIVSEEDKNRIYYNWKEDKFMIDGREYK